MTVENTLNTSTEVIHNSFHCAPILVHKQKQKGKNMQSQDFDRSEYITAMQFKNGNNNKFMICTKIARAKVQYVVSPQAESAATPASASISNALLALYLH